jgi:multimeric flavodoxin WrbA
MSDAPASTSPSRFLFLLSSGRPGGNAEQLARRAAAALPEGTAQEWVDLSTAGLPPFLDLRHTPGGYPAPEGVLEDLYRRTVAATDVVFVAPTYWYSLPAPAKLYLDHWSGFMRAPGREFRKEMTGKGLWLVTVHSGEPHETEAVEAATHTLRLSAGYMRMHWRGALVGHGSRPGDVQKDGPALSEADRFFTAPR